MIALCVLILAAILVAIYWIVSWGLARLAVHPVKLDYGAVQCQEMQRNQLDPSLLDYKYDKIFRTNSRSQELVGRLYCPTVQTNRYILFNHGYNYPWISALKYLPMLLNLGYNVFVPDHRGAGESQGDTITFGYYESRDSLEWLEDLEKHALVSGFEKAEIGVMGESMGAVVSLLMAEQGLGLLFCIADCPFSDWNLMMTLETKKKYNLNVKPFLPGMRILIRQTTGADMRAVNPLRAARNLKIPTLLIHGTEDNLVPCTMSEDIAAQNPAIRLVLQEGARHMNSYAKNPQLYQEEVESFLSSIYFETEHSEKFVM